MDPETYRAESHDRWTRSAAGWGARRGEFQRAAMPVTRWLLDALHLQPGHDVLELAAGPGDTGLLAAELVAPGGRVLVSDFAEAMLDVARARARELGVGNVQFRVLDAESIALDTGRLDAVVCRWGYMLLADREAALRETRRVVRPGGRIALAAWDVAESNPWMTLPDAVLERHGAAPPRDPTVPGPFALAEPAALHEAIASAGFLDVEVAPVDFEQHHAHLDAWWAATQDLSPRTAEALSSVSAQTRLAILDDLREQAAPYTHGDGTLVLPARALCAAASA